MLRRQVDHERPALPRPLAGLLRRYVPHAPPRRKVVLGVPPDLVLGRTLAVREGPVGRMRVVAVAAAAILGELAAAAAAAAPPLDPPVRAGLFLILARLLLPRDGPDVERTKGADRIATSLIVVGAFASSPSSSSSSSCWAGPLLRLLPTLQMPIALLLVGNAIWRSGDRMLLLPAAAASALFRALDHGWQRAAYY